MSAGASTALLAKSSPVSPRTASPLLPRPCPPRRNWRRCRRCCRRRWPRWTTTSSYIVSRDRLALVELLPSFARAAPAADRCRRRPDRAHAAGRPRQGLGPGQHRLCPAVLEHAWPDASSQGAYCTADCYYGKHGYSQRLIGLDASNNAALERAIVIHAASYVDPRWPTLTAASAAAGAASRSMTPKCSRRWTGSVKAA